MKRILGLFLLILIPLSISFLLYAFNEPRTYRGYLVHKYIDTIQITGKNVPSNIYGLSFNLVYQDSVTGHRKTQRVSYEDYNLSEVSNELINYTIE